MTSFRVVAKIWQYNVRNEMETNSTKPVERFFVDRSGVKVTTFGNSHYLVLVVHDSDCCCSTFVANKSHMPRKS